MLILGVLVYIERRTLPHCSVVANDGGVESYRKIIHHLLVDHYGQEGRALYPYSSRLEVHVGQLLVGFRPC